jgi:nitrous oxide reductase accessory protein NosL
MKLFRLLVASVVVVGSLAFAGCTTKTDQDTSIPWSRPAGWEGQIPGMGTTPGSGTR